MSSVSSPQVAEELPLIVDTSHKFCWMGLQNKSKAMFVGALRSFTKLVSTAGKKVRYVLSGVREM